MRSAQKTDLFQLRREGQYLSKFSRKILYGASRDASMGGYIVLSSDEVFGTRGTLKLYGDGWQKRLSRKELVRL